MNVIILTAKNLKALIPNRNANFPSGFRQADFEGALH
jgi:hypothetical protein